MTTQNNMQTENKAFVVGILKKKNIEIKPTKSTGKLRASGDLILVVNTPLGKGEVRVAVSQYAEKKDGSSNTLFKALQTIMNEYKSIEEVGEANADTIKVEGELVDSTYYSKRTEDFVEYLEIKGVFISRVEKETAHYCKVGFEGYISNISPTEQGELEVEIIGMGYEGVAVPVKGIIQQDLVAAFQSGYNVGCTAMLNIAILNQVETKVVQQDVGFGEGLGEVIEKHTTKRIIFGGGRPEYGKITAEQVKQALTLREAKLEDKKKYVLENSQDSAMNTGFATDGAFPSFTPSVGNDPAAVTLQSGGNMPIFSTDMPF